MNPKVQPVKWLPRGIAFSKFDLKSCLNNDLLSNSQASWPFRNFIRTTAWQAIAQGMQNRRCIYYVHADCRAVWVNVSLHMIPSCSCQMPSWFSWCWKQSIAARSLRNLPLTQGVIGTTEISKTAMLLSACTPVHRMTDIDAEHMKSLTCHDVRLLPGLIYCHCSRSAFIVLQAVGLRCAKSNLHD